MLVGYRSSTKEDAIGGNKFIIRNRYVLSWLHKTRWRIYIPITIISARRVFINFVLVLVTNIFSLIALVWPFIAIVLAFMAFLVKNGGIVVGTMPVCRVYHCEASAY